MSPEKHALLALQAFIRQIDGQKYLESRSGTLMTGDAARAVARANAIGPEQAAIEREETARVWALFDGLKPERRFALLCNFRIAGFGPEDWPGTTKRRCQEAHVAKSELEFLMGGT